MRIKSTLIIAGGLIIGGLFSCKKQQAPASLDLDNQTDTIASTGGAKTLTFNSNGAWRIDTTGFGWVKLSAVSGDAGDATIDISVPDTNKTGASRTKLIFVNALNGLARRINIFQ